jgi:hypothetical protein
MREIGREAAVERPHLAHDPKEITRIETAAPPGDGMQVKAFRRDRGSVAIDSGRHMDLEAGLARRPCHRQAMRDEIPVLGHEIDDARLAFACGGRRWVGCGNLGRGGLQFGDRADDVVEAGRPRGFHNEAVARVQLVEP